MLPAIGSTMTAAMPIADARRTARRRMRGRCSARRSVSADGAARDARARRRAERQRARARLDQERVGVPVIAAVELDDAARGAVAARATRTALIAASVPELTKRTRSIDGISCAHALGRASTSSGLGAPKLVPSLRGGGNRLDQAPRRVAVDAADPTTSRSRCNVLPSTSIERASPRARLTNSGDAADRLERADRTVDAAGEQLLSAGKKPERPCRFHGNDIVPCSADLQVRQTAGLKACTTYVNAGALRN